MLLNTSTDETARRRREEIAKQARMEVRQQLQKKQSESSTRKVSQNLTQRRLPSQAAHSFLASSQREGLSNKHGDLATKVQPERPTSRSMCSDSGVSVSETDARDRRKSAASVNPPAPTYISKSVLQSLTPLETRYLDPQSIRTDDSPSYLEHLSLYQHANYSNPATALSYPSTEIKESSRPAEWPCVAPSAEPVAPHFSQEFSEPVPSTEFHATDIQPPSLATSPFRHTLPHPATLHTSTYGTSLASSRPSSSLGIHTHSQNSAQSSAPPPHFHHPTTSQNHLYQSVPQFTALTRLAPSPSLVNVSCSHVNAPAPATIPSSPKPDTPSNSTDDAATTKRVDRIMDFLKGVEADDNSSAARIQSGALTAQGLMTGLISEPSGVQAPPAQDYSTIGSSTAVFDGVKAKIIGQQMEIDDKTRTLTLLKSELKKCKDSLKEHALEFKKELKSKLGLQRTEYETTIKRHLTFIDKLLAEKAELTSKCASLTEEVKGLEKSFKEAARVREEQHEREIKSQKEMWQQAEKVKRDKWIQEKTKAIKDQTIKGLEPEIQRMLSVGDISVPINSMSFLKWHLFSNKN
ncbi:hypothetical protein DFS34DRAFT_360586 [Phlyctochytrium arcticum]|nr:hypothetical protein DFS34DRAFT_360586 [Phlyctochytrium arcticum]